MEQQTIDAVRAAGFDVWMRNPKDSYLLFTDGQHIGYLQFDRTAGYSISTVHMPNKITGTGFQTERHVPEFTKDMLSSAFGHCPYWGRNDANTVKKYRDIEHYRAANEFNADFQLVGKGN